MTRFFVLAAIFLSLATVSAAQGRKVAERWAVLIGVDDYANVSDLQFCGADQSALRERLIDSGFRKENIVLLHDRSAENKHRPSRGNIERQIKLAINSAEKNDLLVVGFSGHGLSVGGKSYLCPNDADLADPRTLISLDGVYEQLRDCAARFKLVLVDACRNDPAQEGQRSLVATEGTRQLAKSLLEIKLPEGVVLLNSCAPGEVSFEERKFGHGVFMHFVLDGLSGAADADGDRAVSLNELQRYAGGRTKAYVIDKFNTSQRPFYRSEGENELMDFALLPIKPVDKSKTTVAEKPVTIENLLGKWKSDKFGTCTLTKSATGVDGLMVYPNGNQGRLAAVLSGRTLRFNWANGADAGSGQLTLSADGTTLVGYWASNKSGQRDDWVLKRSQ